jgi:hypothetical protein
VPDGDTNDERNADRTAACELRLVIGFALVPPAAAAVMFILYLALWHSGVRVFEGAPIDPVDSAASLAMGVGIIAVVVTVYGAVPAVTWLIRRGPLPLGKVLLLGAALGNVPFVLIVVAILVTHLLRGTLTTGVAGLWYGMYGTVRAIVLGLVLGTIPAAIFWVVAIRGTESERASSPSSVEW